ncbi:hypothetical protein PRIPAC_73041 [Pristionchus pacificus]|uniref:G protein-coupled receptor n=1 Tax=Pristionchus pacificus TaxID=54126 RepID=A0A2A6CRP0_PRIPA|nr:hypothetical protein PRIPAC_73041 [Pristionchus pacificus]|eukprot:PDM80884.1 G protein-coupled receptor [Pristionchus pacificus]
MVSNEETATRISLMKMTSAPAIVTTTFNVLADPAENNGRTPQSDLIIGIAMIILSVLCAIAYSIILVAIWRDKELIRMTSYKFMFVLGWCDVIQCFPHALMGVCATPFYNGYAVVTVMLSINRFIQLAFPQLDQTLFSPRAAMVWIGVAVGVMTIYFVALLTPWAAMMYDPKWYGWGWDFTLPASFYLQKMAMSIQVGGIILSGFFYIGVVIMLLRTRKRFAASRNYNTEVKILIQAGTITVYCSILNILWHNYKLILPDDLWTYCALNFMWILNSGVYPIIYFIVNSALRGKIVRATKETRKRFSNSFAKGDSSKVNGTSITRIV